MLVRVSTPLQAAAERVWQAVERTGDRVRTRLRENSVWLNRLTLSLLKQHPEKDSVALKRGARDWNDDYLLEVLTGTSG